MADDPFLVAGGGIAGLATALALSRAGAPVRLFEQARAFEEVGAGLQMSPNGVAALRALGIWEAIEPSCVIPSEIHVRDGRSGAMLQRVPLGRGFEQRFGAPYRVCHRADLLAGLLEVARQRDAIALECGTRVTGARQEDGRVIFSLSEGETAQGRAGIAADGIRSLLRESVCPGAAPRPSGHVIFRSLMPLRDVPAAIAADCVTLWLCPGAHVVHYPVSNWRSFNLVAAVDSPSTLSGWSEPAGSAEVTRHFPVSCDELLELLAVTGIWMRWEGAALPELKSWSKDRLVLTGDAAHATLPYLAQGAVMAIEDAVVLARELGRGAGVEAAFAGFETRRKPRTSRIQNQSGRMGRIYHAGGPSAYARNMVLRLAGPQFALRQNAWIYGWRPDNPH